MLEDVPQAFVISKSSESGKGRKLLAKSPDILELF
jgi:hypothetical protein